MTFLTKLKKSSQVVAGSSFATMVVACVVGQDEVAELAAGVFWSSVAGAIGFWVAEEVQVAVS